MGCVIELFHGQLINPKLKPADIVCERFKATTIVSAKLLFKKGIRRGFPFLVSEMAFDVDREQEMATAMENQNLDIIGASVTLLVLSTVFVALRLLSRTLSKGGFWVSMRLSNLKIKLTIDCDYSGMIY